MIAVVIDTHAVIWYLSSDPRLSKTAQAEIDTTARRGKQVAVSTISIVEMTYLVEKGRIPSSALAQLLSAMSDPSSVLVAADMTIGIAQALSRVDRSHVPDMPDRIIAATAVHLGVPIISRDSQITASSVQTIW